MSAKAAGWRHLHSNMDRLKPFRVIAINPAGLNLHSNMDRLKRIEYISERTDIPYLHSNMDRLKLDTEIRDGRNYDLHSNMDRLKRQSGQWYLYRKYHLHSNMDRLKLMQGVSREQEAIIYIPIWID